MTVLIVIHLMIVLTMVALVLLQKSEGGGLGMGGGGGNFLSSRGTGNLLTRSTAFLAAAFFATSLLLSIIAGIQRRPSSILDNAARPGPSVPVVPNSAPAPLGGPGGGVLNRLSPPPATNPAPSTFQPPPAATAPAQPASPPATPAQPAAPQVPQSK